MSDREKAELICFAGSLQVNANEPLMRCRYVYMLSKPRAERFLGMSFNVSCIRIKWQPAWRWHELRTGFSTERENLSF